MTDRKIRMQPRQLADYSFSEAMKIRDCFDEILQNISITNRNDIGYLNIIIQLVDGFEPHLSNLLYLKSEAIKQIEEMDKKMNNRQIEQLKEIIFSKYLVFSKDIGEYADQTKKNKEKVKEHLSNICYELNKILYM